MINKPPMGVTPKHIHEIMRIQELCRALYEYSVYEPDELKDKLMLSWAEELCERLKGYPNKGIDDELFKSLDEYIQTWLK